MCKLPTILLALGKAGLAELWGPILTIVVYKHYFSAVLKQKFSNWQGQVICSSMAWYSY